MMKYFEMKHTLEKNKHHNDRLKDNIVSLENIIRKQYNEIKDLKMAFKKQK